MEKDGHQYKEHFSILQYDQWVLSEAFEMFCMQHPKTKISQSTFCNCMSDHVILRANTPANVSILIKIPAF